jgi:hypothetical protein
MGVELEPPGVHLRAIMLAGAGAMLLLVGAIAGFAVVYRAEVPDRVLLLPQTFPEPQVRTDETAWRNRVQGEQRRRIAGYAWADQTHALVRIPIERAMRLIVEAGPKAYDPIEPSAAALAAPTAAAQRAMTGQASGQASGQGSVSAPANAADPKP